MDTKNFVYLGSMSRNRSYGVMIDRFRARFIKTHAKRKGDLIRATIETGELATAIGIESILKGLWLVNAELFEIDEARAANEIKLQLIATLSRGLSLPEKNSPIYVAPNPQQVPAVEGLATTTVKQLDVQSSSNEQVAGIVCEQVVAPLKVQPVPEYADNPSEVNPTNQEQPAQEDAQSVLKGFMKIQ